MSISDNNKKIIESVGSLVQICKDGEKGFKKASEHVSNDDFKTILYRLSQQRAMFSAELENDLIKDYGVKMEADDSVVSKLHRGWLDFKAGLSGDDTMAVLKECERGEEHAIELYTAALNGTLPAYLESKVESQLSMIKGSLSQIREFESEVAHT